MKRAILVSSAVLVAIFVISWNYWRTDPLGPVYSGKPVVEWALDLNSPSAQVRQDATAAIGRFDPDALPALTHLLRTPDPVFARVVRLVGWHAPHKLANALFQIAKPYDALVRRAAAAQALRLMGPRAAPALPALTRALQDDKTVSWYAALVLAQLGEDGVTALASNLDRAPPAQAGFICYALSTMGRTASNAAPALVRQLSSKDSNVVERAGTALGAIGPAAIPALQSILNDSDGDERLVAIQALTQMGPVARKAVPDLIRCARSNHAAERAAAVEALGQIQPNSPLAVAALASALDDNARPVRLQALDGLSRSPGTAWPAAAAIQRAQNDENLTIREHATNLLSQMRAAPVRAGGPKQQSSEPNQRSIP